MTSQSHTLGLNTMPPDILAVFLLSFTMRSFVPTLDDQKVAFGLDKNIFYFHTKLCESVSTFRYAYLMRTLLVHSAPNKDGPFELSLLEGYRY